MTAACHRVARSLLADPLTNKGTAFTDEERTANGLHGLLPPHIGTLESQIARRRLALAGMSDDFQRYVFLRDLQDTNEVLFHALVQSDLEGLLPIIYTPTVGEGCQRFSEVWRKPRGVFLSWPNRERMADILADPRFDRVKVIVVSDGERILGLGDQGAGGMGIPIGKLALYTACAGINPAQVLPILLDVGTDNQERREDPLYVGWRAPRVRGADYDAFLEDFVSTIERRFPGALLQWEDFSGKNAFDLLARYRHRLLSFNDDIQGTAATAAGTLLAAVRRTGIPLAQNRFVIFGFGAAGSGIAELLVRMLRAEGDDEQTARRRIWAIDQQGLITDALSDLPPQQAPFARPAAETANWTRSNTGAFPALYDTIVNVQPTVLIGTSGQKNAFDAPTIHRLAQDCAMPVVFPLSNPRSRAEAEPEDLIAWTGGRGIIGTGSPFAVPGVAQVNNVYVFPGVGLGALASGAREVTNAMFLAAARGLGELAPSDGPLLPPVTALREVAVRIATIVAEQAVLDGVATRPPAALTAEKIAGMMWHPSYA
ncbi:NAD-dependent malic enzyme [Novosphingobium taihuense]|uniref:Malate dehydrogenase (Oxaloacetate-decarboxylating) n=1 Tax=Novosphingobium taihuense TaxID=260085 RepID=A0A7W7EV31_9SPHN|nr:NAD-dependent malic enzyme [Novosphingobium taihuense]MBB4612860.1 malate dehydrogenase (oxaloacetate-decarboxylating) [Novosphingobium taihuense]TWH81951.1 malate dehydrogenase (oxaloacetate-decarboxylating) [Novosphingobium taihuense]